MPATLLALALVRGYLSPLWATSDELYLFSGFLPLEKLPIIRLLGGDQFRKFCIICIVILVITVWMTCFFHEEQERPELPQKKKGYILFSVKLISW